MSDLWRLKNAVSRLKPKRWTLVFVNYLDAASKTVDQLKIDLMVMNVVRDRSALGQPNMRCDEFASETARNQVTIHHPGTAGDPVVWSSAFSRQFLDTVTIPN